MFYYLMVLLQIELNEKTNHILQIFKAVNKYENNSDGINEALLLLNKYEGILTEKKEVSSESSLILWNSELLPLPSRTVLVCLA